MALTLSPKALSRWRWLRGMTTCFRELVAVADEDAITCDDGERYTRRDDGLFRRSVWSRDSDPDTLLQPDLSDEVTADSLPRVVRKAWGDPTACSCANPLAGMWVVIVFVNGKTQRFTAPTEPEAWLAALEAAP